MKGSIKIIKGRDKGSTFALSQIEPLIIGRESSDGVSLHDASISRKHCKIDFQDDNFIITDLGSSNGTYLNKKKISNAVLKNSDKIKVGGFLFEVILEEEKEEIKRSVSSFKNSSGAPSASLTIFSPMTEDKDNQEQVIKKKLDVEKTAFIKGADEKTGELKDVVKAHKNLAALYNIGTIINSITELDILFPAILEAIFDVIKADRSALILWDKEKDEVNPVSVITKKGEKHSTDIEISKTVLDEVLKSGVSILSLNAMDDDRFKDGKSIMLQGIKSIMCVPLMTKEVILGAMYIDSSSIVNAFDESDMELLATIGFQAGIAIQNVSLLEDIEKSHYETIFRLVIASEYKDTDTGSHIHRISKYSEAIAKKMGIEKNIIKMICKASPMHDVGKLGIPDAVLLKPCRLDPDERKIIEQHTLIGANILKDPVSEIMKFSHEIALTHHEKWDGTGYPNGLKGEDIPVTGRIVALADVFDALISKRCYKPGFTIEKAVDIIKEERGKHFDPACVDAFFECFDEIIAIYEEFKNKTA